MTTLTPTQSVIDLASRLFAALCVHDGALEVRPSMRGEVLRITVRAHGADTPRLIGRGGKCFDAVRALVTMAAARQGVRVSFAGVLDPVVGVGEMLPEATLIGCAFRSDVERLLTETCEAVFGQCYVTAIIQEDEWCYSVRTTLSDGHRIQIAPHLHILFRLIGLRHGAKVRVELERIDETQQAG